MKTSVRIEAHHPAGGAAILWAPLADAADRLRSLLARIPHHWATEGWIMQTDELICPKCAAENCGRKVYVRIVTDERGTHAECAACAHSWVP